MIGGVFTAVAALPAFLLFMLTIKECRKEIKNNGKKYTDDEITQIRDFFYEMSKLVCKTIKAENNGKSDIVR